MRFLATLNMPGVNGTDTHQLTFDHPSNSQEELCALLNRQEFIIFRMFYRRQNMDGEIWFQDRGEIIINTSWIGKIQEYIDFDSDKEADVQKRTFKRPNNRNF
jgi:hypothetical protein